MRPIGIGLAVALMLAAFAPVSVMGPAIAAPSPAADPALAKPLRDKGMAAATGLVTAAALDCQVADARLIGENTDPKSKVKTSFYELACSNNEGVVVASSPAGAQVFTCLETNELGPDGKPSSLKCKLPGNVDPKAQLASYLAKSGTTCAMTNARALGHSADKSYFEVACQGGGGFIVITSAPPRIDHEVTVNPCIMYDPTGNVACKLSDRAAQLAVADHLIAGSGKPCTVKDRRYVGMSQQKETLFEVSCTEGKGYVVVEATNGTLARAVDCVNSDLCELTDARSARTEQAGLYTQLAKKAGFNCDVASYAPFPPNAANDDVVEMTCSNRPDGAVGVFAVRGGASTIYDCAHSELVGYRCTKSDPAQAYPHLTDELKALGKTTCAVSKARAVGVTTDQRAFIEVACADGGQGFMIEYSLKPLTPKTTIICAQASGISGGCRLPGNTGGHS